MDFSELKKLNINLTPQMENELNFWEKEFLKYNSHTNLISRNDEKYLFEKHVFDSLAVNLWDDFQKCKTILDIGTGGGFPSVILAICFKDKKIIANDSRIKKINFIKQIKEMLKLDNLEVIYSRIEDVEALDVDLILSRAVGKIVDIYEISKKHNKKGTKFLIYKAKSANLEIEEFKKKYKNKEFKIIPYKLPLKENFERNLTVML